LQVKVPVLSLKIYWIYPSSSFILVVKTDVPTNYLVISSCIIISASTFIKYPYINFTISIETINEIGIKVFNKII